MREEYNTSGPGRYEGESPMAMYIDELLTDYGGYETTEDGWSVGVLGKWTVMIDEFGFVYAKKWRTESAARAMFSAALEPESETVDA